MRRYLVLAICLISSHFCFAAKQVHIPSYWATDPGLSAWSYAHSYQTENFILFWGPLAGDNPVSNPPGNSLHFDPKFITDTLEYIYKKYITEYHMLSDAPGTPLGTYKCIIVMNNTWAQGVTGFAFGALLDNMVGGIFVDAAATLDGGVTSHEFTHTLQYLLHVQYNPSDGAAFSNPYGGFFFETHANFMRNHLYPGAIFYDFPRWLGTQSFTWGSVRHNYDCYNILFYIEQVDSLNAVTDLWKKSLPNEYPLQTYKRLKGWDQSQLNDFVYDYAKREACYDYSPYGMGKIIRDGLKSLKSQDPHYLWRQYTILNAVDSLSGHYSAPDEFAPQDYGFNIIPLYPTCAKRLVLVKFKGHEEVNPNAGWRYGFVSVKSDGTISRYSPTYNANESEISFQLNDSETQLYLVVSGAPTSQTSYLADIGWPKYYRFPYELRIANAVPEGYQKTFRDEYRQNGHPHPNGGGWIANTSQVASSVRVGPKALVLGASNVTGNVQIGGTSFVQDATISGNVQILGNTNVTGARLSENTVVKDNAILNGTISSGSVLFKDNALLFGDTFGGTVTMGGDDEIGGCASVGVYLQFPNQGTNGRTNCDGKGANDPSNIDINNPLTLYTEQQMDFSGTVSCDGIAIADTIKKSKINKLTAAIYPNPVSDDIELHISNNFKPVSLNVQIFTTSGQKVKEINQSVSLGILVLPMSGNGLTAGLYYMRISGGDKILKLKFLKQ